MKRWCVYKSQRLSWSYVVLVWSVSAEIVPCLWRRCQALTSFFSSEAGSRTASFRDAYQLERRQSDVGSARRYDWGVAGNADAIQCHVRLVR